MFLPEKQSDNVKIDKNSKATKISLNISMFSIYEILNIQILIII